MIHSPMCPSSSSSASEEVQEQLMTAIRNDQIAEVQHIIQHESVSDTDRMEAMTYAVDLQNENILITLIRDSPRCRWVFRENFHLQTWKDSLRPESNQRGCDGGKIFWIFDILFRRGQKELAMHVALAFPEKTLINQKTWPEVIPAIDASICSYLNCLAGYVFFMKPRIHTQIREPSLTSLKQWCMENCHANIAFYLAVITKDWEVFETMVNTQTSHHVHPILLYQSIEFMSYDRGVDGIRACCATVAVLKTCPLSTDTIHLVPFGTPGLDILAKACGAQGLLDWALLFSTDLEYVMRHCKNCQNRHVLNRILERVVEQGGWEIVSELLPMCSNVETVECVLRESFWKCDIDVVKKVMCAVDLSTITNCCSWTLLVEAIFCIPHDRQDDTVCHLVCLCIASGLSTFQRALTNQRNVYHFFTSHKLPKLQVMQLVVESGTFTHETLHKLCSVAQSKLSRGASEEDKKCYRYMQEAATTPCSLQHLARLTVSHSIGCQPDRPERIQALPLPDNLKYYLRFEDVLAADTQFNK